MKTGWMEYESIIQEIAADQKTPTVNYCMMPKPDNAPAEDTLTEKEKAGLARLKQFHSTGSACAIEQATRPATIGFVLSSSPLALLAW